MSTANTASLTQSRLKELLTYNQLSGDFTWNSGKNEGKVAGTFVKKSGYIMIGIDKKKYPAHRLAWLYMEGYFPYGFDVDHKDRIKHHNWWSNLRLLTRSCNVKNTKKRSDNSTGVTGVSPKRDKFQAFINVNHKRVHLGTFGIYSDAVYARYEAELKFMYNLCKEKSEAFLYLQENDLL